MDYPLFFEEDIPKELASKYEAVIVASLRARELQRGIKSNLGMPKGTKVTTIAMQELFEDKLQFERIEEKPKKKKRSRSKS